VLFLWDFDEAYGDWTTVLKAKTQTGESAYEEVSNRNESQGLVMQAKNGSSYFGALLPVPIFRANQAAKEYSKQSHMRIELLFADAHLEKLNAITDCRMIGGGRIKKLTTNNKNDLADKLMQLDSKAFEHFEPLLKMLEEFLLSNKAA